MAKLGPDSEEIDIFKTMLCSTVPAKHYITEPSWKYLVWTVFGVGDLEGENQLQKLQIINYKFLVMTPDQNSGPTNNSPLFTLSSQFIELDRTSTI